MKLKLIITAVGLIVLFSVGIFVKSKIEAYTQSKVDAKTKALDEKHKEDISNMENELSVYRVEYIASQQRVMIQEKTLDILAKKKEALTVPKTATETRQRFKALGYETH